MSSTRSRSSRGCSYTSLLSDSPLTTPSLIAVATSNHRYHVYLSVFLNLCRRHRLSAFGRVAARLVVFRYVHSPILFFSRSASSISLHLSPFLQASLVSTSHRFSDRGVRFVFLCYVPGTLTVWCPVLRVRGIVRCVSLSSPVVTLPCFLCSLDCLCFSPIFMRYRATLQFPSRCSFYSRNDNFSILLLP